MAYAINDTCISCGACEGGCPVGAISMGDEHMMIDACEPFSFTAGYTAAL